MKVVGRERDLQLLLSCVDRARRGRGGGIVVVGEPGIGKTELLAATIDELPVDTVVLRSTGHDTGMDASFGALTALMWPLVDRLELLDDRPAAVLRGVLGLGPPAAGDRLAIGAAALALLDAVSRESPVVCVVDDWHAVDVASAELVAFVARRLYAESVALLVGTRPAFAVSLPLTQLLLGPLGPADVAVMLADRGVVLPTGVAETVCELAGGNPLAALEGTARLSPDQRAGRAPLGRLPVGPQLVEAFADSLADLPRATRRGLLAVALRGGAGAAELGRALRQLQVADADLRVAADAGLLTDLDGAVAFTHPLRLAAVLQTAPATEVHEVHRALADAWEVVGDVEHQAAHRAATTVAADDDVADLLDRASEVAVARGDLHLATRHLERASELTTDPDRAARRALRAGLAAAQSGGSGDALLARAHDGSLDPRVRSDATVARVLAASWRGDHRMVVDLAARAGTGDGGLDAVARAVVVGLGCQVAWNHLDLPVFRTLWPSLRELGGELDPVTAHGPELLVAALVVQFRRVVDGEPFDMATADVLAGNALADAALDLVPVLVFGQAMAERFAEAEALLDAADELARGAGAIAAGIWLSTARAQLAALTARPDEAYRLALAADADAADTGIGWAREVCRSVLALVDGQRGDVASIESWAAGLVAEGGTGVAPAVARSQLGAALLARGDVSAAIAALEPWLDLDPETGLFDPYFIRIHAPLVECYARVGHHDDARRARDAYRAVLGPHPSVLGRALLARCDGLVSAGSDATRRHEQALDLHRRHPDRFEEARTRLVFGTHLRAEREPQLAREQLQAALDTFEELGCEGWAVQARRQARAAGLRPRGPRRVAPLTEQELAVAELVAEGRRNQEIAAALFVSPKTVEVHLTRIYRKLGLRSRTELSRWHVQHNPAGAPEA